MSDQKRDKPGSVTIKFGLLLVAVGLVLWLAIAMNGGNGVVLWLSALGLVIAAIGFGQRVLAALENKPGARDNASVDLTHAE